MLQTVSEWLWWERLWLPANVSWSDLEDSEGRVYAKASQLHAALPCALCLLLVRYLFERYLATPLANVWGIRDSVRLTAEPNPILESYFCSQARAPSQADVRSLCKKTSWSERRVQIWFKRRRNQERPGLCKRFCEASWRCVFYFFAFVCGVLALYDKPWLYNLKEVWAGFPKQSMLPSQYFYYLLEMGFYLSLLLSLTLDVKRKGAKVFNYAKWHQTANAMFVVFTVVFILTRLIIFPFWLIHCTWVYPLEEVAPFFGYYFSNVMLLVLQILHLYWAVLISQMAYKFIFSKLEGDDRSEEEEDDDSDSPKDRRHKLSHINGSGARGRANGY
ncbi:ceramide synthase 2 isoform X2 [Anarrhichthys ocellatus]|uniref:ceramide synthase 2 isoform X2 n=1 Tax=Anarrhichthys ocellatus TaxID=433405 RepID=UPI0012EE640A|nr:ceramide synthase 2-like isoform X2 [Anarrhichthys ocellatus]